MVDRIFTRIGASDNLAQGQSTFFVEMSELAYILRCSKARSLIILDEIGRGTSTYDGLSIAWAAVDYLCNEHTHIRTLFATHYHELTALEREVKGVRNLNVDVSEENGNIVFLHRIVEGSASRSYGIHVAKLAGVPEKLLEDAQQKLSQLEAGTTELQSAGHSAYLETDGTCRNVGEKACKKYSDNALEEQQLSLFIKAPNPVIERIRDLDLMEITPSQAIGFLEELKKEIDD